MEKTTKKKKPRRGALLSNRKRNDPMKLTDELEKKLCAILASGTIRHEDACEMVGISRGSFYNWRSIGTAKPHTRYGQFLEAVTKAETVGRVRCEKKLLDDPDWKATWKLMQNRWPKLYRESWLLRQEISGPEGTAVPVAVNPFTVEVVINGQLPEHPEVEDMGPVIEIDLGNGNGNGNGNGSY